MEKSIKETNDQNKVQENKSGLPPDQSSLRLIMRIAGWGALLTLTVCIGFGVWMWNYAHSQAPGNEEAIILIPKGSGIRQIQTILATQGIVTNDIRFLVLARLTETAGHLQAGEYRIPPRLTPLEVLNLLQQGAIIRHQVTIPEGMDIRQIIAILAQGNWIVPDRFEALSMDQKFIKSLGLQTGSLEGYLFPDTYNLTRGDISEKRIISMMVARFLSVWQQFEIPAELKLSRHEVITLASIVEKETAASGERPLIAGVFRNRLKKNMRLQSDPTVIYSLPGFDGNLTRKDLQTETPYNTYVITGLPPGPICNPGKDSIAAVLQPAEVPYLYFVAKNDGTHHFSTNLREHNRAVRKYQKKNNRTAAPNL